MQDACKNALARHDAVADLMIDLAVAMALLADLRDLKEYVAHAQARSDRQFLEPESLGDEVFPERAEVHIRPARAEIVDLAESEEAHLTVPVPRVRVAVHAVLRDEEHAVERVFLRAALLTDAQRSDFAHINLPPDTWRADRATPCRFQNNVLPVFAKRRF